MRVRFERDSHPDCGEGVESREANGHIPQQNDLAGLKPHPVGANRPLVIALA